MTGDHGPSGEVCYWCLISICVKNVKKKKKAYSDHLMSGKCWPQQSDRAAVRPVMATLTTNPSITVTSNEAPVHAGWEAVTRLTRRDRRLFMLTHSRLRAIKLNCMFFKLQKKSGTEDSNQLQTQKRSGEATAQRLTITSSEFVNVCMTWNNDRVVSHHSL